MTQPGATDLNYLALSFLGCALTRGVIIYGSTMREENLCLLRAAKPLCICKGVKAIITFHKYRFEGKSGLEKNTGQIAFQI
jgi:hypothetical protein